jgi:hypothetical protein
MYNPAVSKTASFSGAVRPPTLKNDRTISPLRRIRVYPRRTAISFAAGTPAFLGDILDRPRARRRLRLPGSTHVWLHDGPACRLRWLGAKPAYRWLAITFNGPRINRQPTRPRRRVPGLQPLIEQMDAADNVRSIILRARAVRFMQSTHRIALRRDPRHDFLDRPGMDRDSFVVWANLGTTQLLC